MSGGLNKLFKANPQQFMTTHAFNTQPHNALAFVTAGVRAINLAYNGTLGNHNVTEVQPAPNNPSMYSKRFNAYYLPWRQGGTPSVQLGTGANYFFTPALTGCRLIIGAGAAPQVTHVDGGTHSDNQMDAMCNVRSNGGGFTNQRYWDNGVYYASIVIGVRGVGGWTFYAQNFNPSSTIPLNVVRI